MTDIVDALLAPIKYAVVAYDSEKASVGDNVRHA